MNRETYILHGVIAGLVSTTACIIYLNVYEEALGVGYAKIVNIGSIAGGCLLGCMLISTAYVLLQKYNAVRFKGLFNVIIAGLSFVSIIGPIAATLPLDTKTPELFPGLVIPMHFMPALAFLTIEPFFTNPGNRIFYQVSNILRKRLNVTK